MLCSFTRRVLIVAMVVLLGGVGWLQGQQTARGESARGELRGAVTDPSGARIPGALLQLIGPGGQKRVTSNEIGEYAFSGLQKGQYRLRAIAQGFSVTDIASVEVSGTVALDVALEIHTEAQVVNVEDEANSVGVDPQSNAGAIVLREKDLEAFSDDPDQLEQELQAMAGPAAGPNGGQIFIDGFTGGNLPPKSSIREIRINANPFSSEYDRPGFGRIEIFTRPGTDAIRGQAFFMFNDEALNSRSPLLAQSKLPPYQQRFFGFNLSGPIKKQRASFGLNAERRFITENAFIYATTLTDDFNFRTVNEAVLTPQTRTTISPRVDFTINPKNTLVVRYQRSTGEMENEGVGDFALASRAYTRTSSEHTVQITENAVLSPNALNETRFQYMRANQGSLGDNSIPALAVQGAFESGGPQVGNSGALVNRMEFSNNTTYTYKTHTFKWGARLRHTGTEDTSVNNFGGSYAFFGGFGPALDASNQPVVGTSVQLTALERYRRTLMFLAAGYSAEQVRALGGGASQFSMSAGTPTTNVGQYDVGLFINDDVRLRPNLTLSYGLRYETQSNIGDYGNWAPRAGVAWGIDGTANRAARTVLRAGFGIFYDRIGENLTLQALRFNGATQQSYLLMNPDFFPLIPSPDSLGSALQPQQLRFMYAGMKAPRNIQSSIGLERQINRSARLSVQYVNSRGIHLQRSRNINTPIDGVYPFGDMQLRMLNETSGLSRSHQLIVSPSVSFRKMTLFGFYMMGFGKTDAEGQPADPYNLRAEWGPSSFADVRHRGVIGTNIPLLWGFSISPFLMANGGSPYNLIMGRDTNRDGVTSERPGLLSGLDAAGCTGSDRKYMAGFGCFDLNPAAGTAIGRNWARGPSIVNLNLRVSRTWSFGNRGESGPGDFGPPDGPGGGGMRGGGGPPPGGGGGGMRGGGGPPPGGGGGGPMMFGGGGSASGKKYNLTLSLSARNVLNRANYAAPSGDLSSPFFGEYRSLAGMGPFGVSSTYNRKIDVQLRFTF